MVGPSDSSVSSAPDGRLQRSERSREAIAHALLELVGEGILEPTAEQVAARARVGIRTVFRHFSDMESLFAEMSTHLANEVLPALIAEEPDGSPEKRARQLVARRVALFDRVAPYKRSANVRRWRSPFLQEQHGKMVRRMRQDLHRYLPELADAPAEIGDAIEVATSFETFDRLRTEQRLSRARTAAAMERAVLSLVASG